MKSLRKMPTIKEVIEISRIAVQGYALARFGYFEKALKKLHSASSKANQYKPSCLMPKPRSIKQNIVRRLFFFAHIQGGIAAYRAGGKQYAWDCLTTVEEEWDCWDKMTLLYLGLLSERNSALRIEYYSKVLKLDPRNKTALDGLRYCREEQRHVAEIEESIDQIRLSSKTDCSYFKYCSPIKCAINPAGSCDSCKDYDPIIDDCPF